MTPLVFLDTETTGVHPDRAAWEIAMIRRDDFSQRETQFYVDVDLNKADPFGLSVGRFYERHPLGRYLAGEDEPVFGPSFDTKTTRTAANEVARWTHGAHIVGAVPNFDTEVLSSLLRDHGLIPAWHYHLIDVENLAVGYIAATAVEGDASAHLLELPWKSDALGSALGVLPPSDDERHTALGDARWAMRIYDKVVAAGGAHLELPWKSE